MSLAVYAIAGRGMGRIAEAGLAGERLRSIRVGAVEAIVGEVARRRRPTERNLRAYHRLVWSLWARSAALLPARFGTVVRDRAELELVLLARQETLRRRLTAVRNRAQMTIRIVQRARAGRRALAATTRTGGDRTSRGRRYLAHRAATAYAVAELAPVRAAVLRWVEAERVEKLGKIATIYHLVPRTAAEEYRDAADRAARDARVRLRISGPWPAYAFAEEW